MKMNLSVVMGIVDKTSKPLQGMASDSDYYAKKIKKIQSAQSDDSSALTMIASYQKIQKELDKNALEGEEATEKLAKLKAQMAATKEPSAALTNRLAKQTEKVAKLSANNDKYENSLHQTSKQMKKAGVNVRHLDSEFDRLSQSQRDNAKQVEAVSNKYKRLRTAMAPVQRLSQSIKMPNLKSAALGEGAAILGGLSLGGLFSQMNSAAAEMDKLSKAANNLNMPVEELQAMQSQAEHAGVSSDTMSAAMVRFTKRLGVLQTTGKGAMGSFLQKGKNPLYRELKGAKDTQQAYDSVLESFSKLKTNQEQMAFADAAFGQDGRKMLIMLRDGTKGLTLARKEFNETGGGVTSEDAAKAEAYNDAMQKVQESISSVKFAVLAPVMMRLTEVFTVFSNKFKDVKWRTDLIEKIKAAVNALYDGFKFLGNIILFISQNFKGMIAVLAIFKIAMIAINAAVMANPIGLMVAAIGAAIIAIVYLIDKFVGFDVILKAVGEAIGWVWDGIKALINMLPDALIPDGWKASAEAAGGEVDKLNEKLNTIKDKNAKLGITTDETINQTTTSKSNEQRKQGLSGNIIPMSKATPLTNQTLKSQAEVAVTIKSEKPISIDKATSEKGTNLNLNVGDMMMSY
ncbi:hypothetical protein [Moritella sp. F3]|uniref:hypothetical protein n=1 Tax=Moritella sp. F3 TaxID=2718882 RepID=UPI0018E14D08|nr:hypothetical protein [Moritella sp. F3]GIC79508.1 hypothetical protein FMO001_42350 [Moritella sp. F1]GIC79786.1 hypothetical protein FMO003_00670 [Moritella sp. F3]